MSDHVEDTNTDIIPDSDTHEVKVSIKEPSAQNESRQPLPPPSYREAPAQHAAQPAQAAKISKVKLGFLYLLIGGLSVTAIIAVAALLVGSVNQSIQSAFVTTSLIVIYSALLLTVVLADTKNQLGRSLLPTTVFVLLMSQMAVSVLSTWDIIGSDLAGRFVALHFTVMAGAFLIEATLRLSLHHRLVRALSTGTSASVGLLVAALIPWVLAGDRQIFGDLYYRIIAAISIIIVTMVIITAIMNRITVYQRPESRLATTQAMPGGMVAIISVVGVITGMFMIFGIATFAVAATSLPSWSMI